MTSALIAAGITIVICMVIGLAFVFRNNRRNGPSVKSSPFSKHSTSIGGSSVPIQTTDSTQSATSKHQEMAGLSERLAPRFAAVGVLVVAIFGALTARLWSLQVLSGEKFAQESKQNLLTTIKTPASRGRIFDVEGYELVSNASVPTILADVDVAKDRNVMMRLSALVGIPYNVVRQRIMDASAGAQAQRVVVRGARFRDISYIAEHPDAFPGVVVQERTHRVYPYGALAAHVLGYTGLVSENDLENVPVGMDYQSGDEVGKSGVEASYEKMLFGAHGERVVVADVDGRVREVRSETAPTQGNDVYLTLSARVQKIAEDALAHMIAPQGAIGTGKGVAGACVAMEIETGNIVAMANFPTFNPESFVGGITQDAWNRYTSTDSQNPLMNRCIAGTYPAASTFKAFTGMAGLHYGFADAAKIWDCNGAWDGFGEKYIQHCWDLDGHGPIDFRRGIVVSCDIVFYSIAKDFYDARARIGENAM